MAFVREKRVGGRSYYYLVESVRVREGDQVKIKQRLIHYYGRQRPRGRQRGLVGSRRAGGDGNGK